MLSSTYYGFWDYWKLYHKVTFDGVNKLILINDGETSLDVQTDLYSDWKEWALLRDNTKYERAFSTVGGEPTIEGQFLDVTYFLVNGWKIKPYPGSYDLTLVGNIFDIDGGSIKVPADVDPLFSNNISINTNTSVIVRQVSPTVEVTVTGSSAATASLNTNQEAILYNVEDKVIAIESILSSPVTASLVSSQETALYDIQSKLTELWQVHGLQSGSDLTVRTNERLVGSISQSISTTGSGSAQETVVSRV